MRQDSLEKWGHGFTGLTWLYLALGVIGVAAALILAASLTVTLNSSACGQSCHVVNPQYESWKSSKHADVPCYRCHVGGSALDWISHVAIEKPGNALRLINRGTAPLNADGAAADTIANDRCLECHAKIARERTNTTGRRYRSRHAEHTAADVRCTDCHNRVAHKDAESHSPIAAGNPGFRYADRLKMEKGCWRCHSANPGLRDDDRMDELKLAELPPTVCASCHVSPPAPASGALNHVGWPGGGHGKMRGQDFADCLPCHTAAGPTRGPVSDCTGCHNDITMPHKTDANSKFYESEPQVPLWSREHARYRRREESCRMCHPVGGVSDSCTACHHADYLSGGAGKNWAQEHKIKANERDAGCQTCHMLEYCSYCHERGEKPPPGLFMYKLRLRLRTR